MTVFIEYSPYFLAMAVLAVASAFFSCAEAALFSLQPDDRRALAKGNAAQRTAIDLLAKPERLLTSVLFWNLMINVVYFALASVVGIQLEQAKRPSEAFATAVLALLTLIVFAEMLPKTLGVQKPRLLSALLSLPLSGTVRATDAVMPALTWVNGLAQRLLLPGFRREPYLELQDIEKAIKLSSGDRHLADNERSALQNIVSLSELQAEELMRPRRQYDCYQPPIHLANLGGDLTRSGYVLVSEAESDEVAAAIPLKLLPTAPKTHLENYAQPVIYVPWCASGAAVLEELHRQQREVAAIVNEFGETVGIVTLEDLLATIFEDHSSRSARMLAVASIAPAGDGVWEVTGMTSLRRLQRHFNAPLAETHSATVAGVLQESLHRFPEAGDEVLWSGFRFHVLSVDESGTLRVQLTRALGDGLWE
ncbi:MAG: DUF21 domain-containing protein [Planctomycetales bacterium]|nr:DUF21 domain-containing protein [Planctomycetales bacterium]